MLYLNDVFTHVCFGTMITYFDNGVKSPLLKNIAPPTCMCDYKYIPFMMDTPPLTRTLG